MSPDATETSYQCPLCVDGMLMRRRNGRTVRVCCSLCEGVGALERAQVLEQVARDAVRFACEGLEVDPGASLAAEALCRGDSQIADIWQRARALFVRMRREEGFAAH